MSMSESENEASFPDDWHSGSDVDGVDPAVIADGVPAVPWRSGTAFSRLLRV